MAKKVGKKTNVKKICAWCNRTMQNGTEPVTHGICKACGKRVMENNEKGTVRFPTLAGSRNAIRGFPTPK